MAEKEIWQKIGEGFVQAYYEQFDNTDRSTLGLLYVSLFIILIFSLALDPYFKS